MNLILIVFVSVVLISGVTTFLLWEFEIPLYYAAISPFLTLLFLYILGPIVFRSSRSLQRHFIFQPTEKVPPGMNLNEVANEQLTGCRNFYLYTNGHKIGVWQILPKTLAVAKEASIELKEFDWEDSLRNGGLPVIIYFHGNTGTRALDHRIELYKLGQKEDCHVIAFDYRGFIDSSPIDLSEDTVVEDGIYVYNWIRQIVGNGLPIFMWGHSLGTGISSHTVARLCRETDNSPSALVLESPFTNIGEGMKYHRRAKLYSWLPGFHLIFVSPLHKNNIAFKTDEHIAEIKIPILILHATDDSTVPFHLGEKLYKIALLNRPVGSKPIKFQTFGEGHGHKSIYTARAFPGIVRDFFMSSVLDDWAPPVSTSS